MNGTVNMTFCCEIQHRTGLVLYQQLAYHAQISK
jgi:hypothetical protein